MRRITADMKQAMRDRLPIALLAEIDHPDGVVNVWSRAGTLAYDGKEWIGLGALGRVTPVGTAKKLALREMVFSLRGIPPHAVQFLDDNVRNRVARLWFACIKPRRKVVGDPIFLDQVRLDTQKLQVDESGLCTILLTGQTGFTNLQRAQNVAWTTEEARTQYADETGFDLMPGLVSRDIKWRLSD